MSPTNEPPRRLILVSGATGGIGTEVCRALARRSFVPIVAYRMNRDLALAAAEETGGTPLQLDFSEFDTIDSAVTAVLDAPGQLVGVAHCASPAPKLAPFARITSDDMESFWRQNVLGPHRLFAGLMRHGLKSTGFRTVVAVTSAAMGDASGGAAAGFGAYTVSKYGLCGVLALLAAEFPWLKVATVSPGFTDTKMLEAFDKRFIDQAAARTPLRSPADVAGEIVSHFE